MQNGNGRPVVGYILQATGDDFDSSWVGKSRFGGFWAKSPLWSPVVKPSQAHVFRSLENVRNWAANANARRTNVGDSPLTFKAHELQVTRAVA